MPTKFVKASEIAKRLRVSRDAVYLWIRSGRIPSECVIRIAGTIRVDEQKLESLLFPGDRQARGVGRTEEDGAMPGADHHEDARGVRQKAERHAASKLVGGAL
jgi:excisionase family DNA binding protein